MKITGINNNLMSGGINNTLHNKTLEDILCVKNDNAVQVTISERGKKYYRDSIQRDTADVDTYEKMMGRRGKLLEANLSSDLDYDFQLGNELEKYKQDGVYTTIKEKADNLLKSYANLYDEIVQGYAKGTREIHVVDAESEKGYRILTQEDEINSLNSSYKKYADDLEAKVEEEPKIRKAMNEYMKKLEQINVKKPALAQSYYDNVYSKQNEIIPENLSDKLVNATMQFVKQYSMYQTNMGNFQSMLQNINIF